MIVALLICGMTLSWPLSAYCANDDVSSQLTMANSAVGEALIAIRRADDAGADASLLLDRLSVANEVLADANQTFRQGDYVNASLLAARCLSLVDGIVNEAESMRSQAENERQDRLLLTASMSCIGVSMLVAFGLFGWRLLRRRYVRHALGMKPEKVTQS